MARKTRSSAAANTQPSPPLLGTVLVIGGCGFIGYHLVRQLLDDIECARVVVLDRNVERNVHEDERATYMRGDIGDSQALAQLLDDFQPTVVFHAASPTADSQLTADFARTNVDGTRAILDAARRSEHVQALVLTSTVDVYANPPHLDVAEDHALWPRDDRSNEYNRTKAVADVMVRAANGPDLRTVALRLGHVYGERQSQGLVEVLDTCVDGQRLVQVGDGRNLMEVASAANVASAHVLAAKALLLEDRPDDSRATSLGAVAGEAFNVSDGAPVPFWHHVRMIWAAARGAGDGLDRVLVLPGWVMWCAVWLAAWLYWALTLDTVRPPATLSRTALDYCLHDHTYSLDKARARLGFRPVVDHDAEVARGATWMLENGEKYKGRWKR